jgi:hypothetical protein
VGDGGEGKGAGLGSIARRGQRERRIGLGGGDEERVERCALIE